MTARAMTLALVLALALPAAVWATTFRGAGLEDPETTVTVRVTRAGVVRFDYSDVLVTCSNGERLREPGAEHSALLGADDRFIDTIEQQLPDGATGKSWVKGRLRHRRARGALTYDLLYEGGECHSGKLHWKARRK